MLALGFSRELKLKSASLCWHKRPQLGRCQTVCSQRLDRPSCQSATRVRLFAAEGLLMGVKTDVT